MPNRTKAQVGAIYHIINRGVEKRRIFMKPQDYSRFILGLYFYNDKNAKYDIWTNLQKNKNKTLSVIGYPDQPTASNNLLIDERERVVDLLAFTLMSNHFHLIIREIKEGGIISFMQKMGGYVKYFNKQYDRVGPLFQGRYKSIQIKDEGQLRTTFVYVHTNPVELKEPEWKDLKVKNARNAINWLNHYRWSSYHDYIGNLTFPDVTQRDLLLKLYGGEKECRQAIDDWILFKAGNLEPYSEILE